MLHSHAVEPSSADHLAAPVLPSLVKTDHIEEKIQQRITSPWDDKNTEYLKERWLQGASATQIAKHLGMTRNAVIGRVHRLGIQRNFGYTFWTYEQLEQLKTLWKQNFSASQIAEMLCREFDGKHVAKSTVLHKARRLGLHRRIRTAAAPVKRRQARKVIPFATIIDADIPLEQRRTFAQLERGDCKWPIGDPGTPEFFFCGGKAFDSGPYCSAHHHRGHGYEPGKRQVLGRHRFG